MQCLAIWERHANVLEFKAGECIGPEISEDNICDISPDLPLKTLVRLGKIFFIFFYKFFIIKSYNLLIFYNFLEGEDVHCPFPAPLTFTYKKEESGNCSSPMSQINKCIESSKLILQFQACPDIDSTVSKGITYLKKSCHLPVVKSMAWSNFKFQLGCVKYFVYFLTGGN